MKNFLVLVISLVAFTYITNVNASVFESPLPDEWELGLTDQLVTNNYFNYDVSNAINETYYNNSINGFEGFVVQINGYFNGNDYEVVIERGLSATGSFEYATYGNTSYENTLWLIQFARVDSSTDQPIDNRETCKKYVVNDCVYSPYYYRVRVKENHVFYKMTTYVTLFFEDL